LHYPGDYGLIPQTLSEDGDPLDVLVLMTNSTYPGILLEARPIALLKMKDTQETDEKLPCVEVNDARFASYKNVTDVEEHI
jgi:inorganic pyrophosphatase